MRFFSAAFFALLIAGGAHAQFGGHARPASTMMPPLLHQLSTNSHFFADPNNKVVFLVGSHSWNTFQDTDTSASPAAMDYNRFVQMLHAHGHNATILWRKDLPVNCGWDTGATWARGPWPWLRTGPGNATDGALKWDLTQFNQAYFDRLRSRVLAAGNAGVYAIVELFDTNDLNSFRCADGFPFTGANNINGVDDGYVSGTSGVASATMTSANAISDFQDAYLRKTIDTLNDLPNVLYEVAEEQPTATATWWFPHVMSVIRTYEASKPLQHLVGIGSMTSVAPNDATLYASVADWIAPTVNTNFANQFPANVAVNNQGKLVINDSDHSYFWKAFTNSDGTLQDQNMRTYLWENLTNGAAGVILMDPWVVNYPGPPVRNACSGVVNTICTGATDPKFEPFRNAMGFLNAFVNGNTLDLAKMTPQTALASTGFCIADNIAVGSEFIVYAPAGGTFTVNLSAQNTRLMNFRWIDPSTGAVASSGQFTATSSTTQSFTTPGGITGDAVLYLVDAAGHA